MDWNIRKFEDLNNKELYDILRLRNQVFIVEQNCPYEDCDNRDKDAYHLFLENNEEIIAYLRILKRGVSYEEVSIGRVVVDKKYRRKDIARNMMVKAIDFIERSLKEREIRISAQAYLVNFYKSIGFKEVSEPYLEDNIPHIEMFYSRVI